MCSGNYPMRSRQPIPSWRTKKKSLFSWKKAVFALALLVVSFFFLCYWYMVKCGDQGYGEPLESQRAAELPEIKKGLETDVATMQNLGPRNSVNEETYAQLRECEEWI